VVEIEQQQELKMNDPTEPPALTNCDGCANDYVNLIGGRGCTRVDALLEAGDFSNRLFGWTEANVNEAGTPNRGSTGCPGFTPKVVAS
jgi:hypothetical protein